MYQGKLRKITIILLALYTALILYFLYIGFNRAFIQDTSLRYSLIPEGIPLHYPMGRDFKNWFFELGNFVAFIPFGVVIPLLFRSSFIRFIILFILSITFLETLQMLSHLGSFDIEDVIINTLGAALGFCAQRLVPRDRDKLKGICRIILTAVILSIGVTTIVGGINNYLEKGGGEVVALNELTLKDGSVLWDESISSFTAVEKKVEPQINMYSRKNTRTNEFTYLLNSKYAEISGYVAIPDDLINSASKGNSNIIFSADGTEIYSLGLSAKSSENALLSFQTPLNGAKELTIKIINDDPNLLTNAVMWDITLTEVNTGQKIKNSIKEKLSRLF
ncbi:VanZ family protein [Paenibacillus sp. SYP-B3998]|uniref:VanZ family protein n=1 Tax=Paenibacillus sp. SYP-B3998 TaxID=2678564 RepID=A0A6G4A463_9BACL|nr:VanZ family protein [Paenibacillus sp. SYP-B3998]NEW09172.1 VanZ family protein [Paenibacillus sp. SYP-B3998]